jgi:hypothetical protein
VDPLPEVVGGFVRLELEPEVDVGSLTNVLLID